MSAAAPSGRLRRLVGAIAPTAALLALLVAAEVMVRRTLPRIRALDALVTAPEQRFSFSDRESTSIFEGDPLLFWRLQPGLQERVWDFTLVSTSGDGLRHPRPLQPKPPGGVRIVTVGDSVTFGYRVPLAFPDRPRRSEPAEQAYPRLLEAALRRANPGRWIEVVPLAVPGYSSHQGFAWLRREIGRLEPDVVTVCFGWNDVSLRRRTDSESMPLDLPRVLLRGAALRSQAFLHGAAWLQRKRPSPVRLPPQVERVPRARYVTNSMAMVHLAWAHGAVPVVIAPVYRDEVTFPFEAQRIAWHRASLKQAAVKGSIRYLEVPELTETAWPGNEALFGETIHPNAAGHRLLAERLLELLASTDALRGLTAPSTPTALSSPGLVAP